MEGQLASLNHKGKEITTDFFLYLGRGKILMLERPGLSLVCLVKVSKMQTCKKILLKIIASRLFLVKVVKLIGTQQLKILIAS